MVIMKNYVVETGFGHFKKTIEINLPTAKRIGVLVSGGADSAILLYLIAKLNKENNNPSEIIPLTVPIEDGAKSYATILVSYINHLLELDMPAPAIVGNPNLHHSQRVSSGRDEAFLSNLVDFVVYGSQQVPPKDELQIDWEYPARPDSINYSVAYCPFALVDKRNTMDLYRIFDRMDLLSLTHSCTEKTLGRCGKCFNCIERSWALEQLNLEDSGQL